MGETTGTFGGGRRTWSREADQLRLTAGARPAKPVGFPARPLPVEIDLARSALVVIDMQNTFCAVGGLTDLGGKSLDPVRAPIAPLNGLLPVLRDAEVPVLWVNWGVREDRLNLPPMLLHAFDPDEKGRGIGDPLPEGRGPVLTKGAWSAAIVDELDQAPTDIHVDKHRISGFWDTPLDSILRQLDIRTLLFAGVNLDICVYHTLADAHFLGYDCVLLEDCCATTSPPAFTEVTLHNTMKCFGFVARAADLAAAIARR